MTMPAFQLLSGDEDILADLSARGVELTQPLGDSQLDALASEYLGEIAASDREIARYTEARDAELRRITMKYDTLMAPHQIRRTRLEAFVCELARRADYGKKKSRDVGNGTYGRKLEPERVRILDQDKAVAFAQSVLPSAVKTKTTVTVDHRAIAPAVLARLHATGELPEGFEHTAERDVPFAKPEV